MYVQPGFKFVNNGLKFIGIAHIEIKFQPIAEFFQIGLEERSVVVS